jgi:hypothetical protein
LYSSLSLSSNTTIVRVYSFVVYRMKEEEEEKIKKKE